MGHGTNRSQLMDLGALREEKSMDGHEYWVDIIKRTDILRSQLIMSGLSLCQVQALGALLCGEPEKAAGFMIDHFYLEIHK